MGDCTSRRTNRTVISSSRIPWTVRIIRTRSASSTMPLSVIQNWWRLGRHATIERTKIDRDTMQGLEVHGKSWPGVRGSLWSGQCWSFGQLCLGRRRVGISRWRSDVILTGWMRDLYSVFAYPLPTSRRKAISCNDFARWWTAGCNGGVCVLHQAGDRNDTSKQLALCWIPVWALEARDQLSTSLKKMYRVVIMCKVQISMRSRGWRVSKRRLGHFPAVTNLRSFMHGLKRRRWGFYALIVFPLEVIAESFCGKLWRSWILKKSKRWKN